MTNQTERQKIQVRMEELAAAHDALIGTRFTERRLMLADEIKKLNARYIELRDASDVTLIRLNNVR